MKKPLGVLAVLAVAAASAGQSQTQPEAQGPTFRTGIDVIAVDVAVVDGRGQPVEDLLAPDFVVKIDGEQRRVVSAEHVRIDVAAARKEAADPFETLYTTNVKPTNGRLIVIAVDQLGIRAGEARSLLASVAKFLDRLSPADRVAFVAYPEPGVSIGFTSDHLRIKRGMERVVGSQQPFSGRFNIGLYEAIALSTTGDGRLVQQVLTRECPGVRGPALEQCADAVFAEARTMVGDARQNTKESLRGLYNLLMALSTIEGPKSLILLSEGIVLDTQSDLDDVIRAAALARVTINALLMDVPRYDVTQALLRPTITEDREMQVHGLQDLASASRGSLYNIVGTGEGVLARLASEMLAYYMLGVEQVPGDRDDSRHRIDVEVRRRNVTVRSRRAFVLSSATTTRRKAEETLLDALRSPFGVAEVPVRVTTFTQQEGATDKVRIVLAAEVGQPGGAPEDFTVGYALLDGEGNVVSSAAERRTLSVPNGLATAPRDYLREIVVDPGVYSLRFGVVDSSGRRGGVVREVSAWKLAGEEFALGDLLIGDAGNDANEPIRPGVEPRVQSNLGAFLELYSTSPAVLEKATVNFEIADGQDSPALIAASAQPIASAEPTRRVGQVVIAASLLPPGRYVARARVLRDGNVAGILVRPFILDGPPTAAGSAQPVPFLRSNVERFDPRVALRRDVLDSMLDGVEKRSPELKGPLAEARAGRYGIAAIEALTAGDQTTAAFFKGLDWYSKGDIGQAATQLQLAAGPRREFFAAAFYLGASFAAAGRDRDAAGVWQLALGSEPRPAFAYTLLADARFRDDQPSSVIDVLRPAYERTPADDDIAHRLASAYLFTGRYGDALPVLDGFLSRHPTDQVALFAAVFAQYQVTTRERLALSAADSAKLARYVRAYQGPLQPLLAKYLQTMRSR